MTSRLEDKDDELTAEAKELAAAVEEADRDGGGVAADEFMDGIREILYGAEDR